ncbi:MAG: hypothetical protein ACOC40_00210 [Thermoplasmatota archaeon]
MDIDDEEDIEQLKELMETLNETVPGLISGIVEAVYNAEDSQKLAKNTANFYKELVEAGMEKEQAYQLTRDFMKGRDVTSLVREAISGAGPFGEGHKGDFDKEELEENIRKKIKKKMESKMDEEDWE